VRLRRYANVGAFAIEAQGFLLRHEAHHHLLLGIVAGLQAGTGGAPEPYLATVLSGPEVVAVALMTPPRNLVVSLTAAPEAPALVARDLHDEGWPVPGLLGPAEASHAFADAWAAETGSVARAGMTQRIYRVERVRPVDGVPGALRRATVADRDLLVRWVAAFSAEAGGDDPEAAEIVDARLTGPGGGLYLWEDGGALVSLAGHAGPTPNGMRIGPVYTPPEHRGRGYAGACVAALSRLLLDGGRRWCFLFTAVTNTAAIRAYERVGYEPVCVVQEYRFAPRG